jgi:ribosomal protein S18 acetylase RimI-like enzyme
LKTIPKGVMQGKKIIKVDLNNLIHCQQLLRLLNEYMEDEMGIGQSMPGHLGARIIQGLKQHPAYLGFFVCLENEYVALANCNVNYSTWAAKFLINIHDFIVSPGFRKQGLGAYLLAEIESYAKTNGFCKINLEVRSDNFNAQNLYRKMGFSDCRPPMYFWQKEMD